MHLLNAQAGSIESDEAIDLGQDPGDIVILSAADTELTTFSAAYARLARELGVSAPSLRLGNIMHLSHPMSVDVYVEAMIPRAKLVIARVLGGSSYWSYGVEQLEAHCRRHNVPLAFLPGDDQPDKELTERSSLTPSETHRLWQYCVHGGADNALHFLRFACSRLGCELDWLEPILLPRAGIYWPGLGTIDTRCLSEQWQAGKPVVAIVFYRALLQAANVAPIDAMVRTLVDRDINPLPIFCASLKDPVCAAVVAESLSRADASVIINATGFAVSAPGKTRVESPLEATGRPILQMVFSGGNESSWRGATNGLSAKDIAMNVALPEVDGRILSRAVSFKSEQRFDESTQCAVVAYEPIADRVEFVARLAIAWARLASTKPGDRRVAIVLANYPNRDGRIGNGVGLDTPAAAVRVLEALQGAGYETGDALPRTSQALMTRLLDGPTNDRSGGVSIGAIDEAARYSLEEYEKFLAEMPNAAREAVYERWGSPSDDPFFDQGRRQFIMSAHRFGHIWLAVQPARGYNIDPVSTYHDPALVPPHGYLAFYAWLRESRGVHAVVHLGKHGNLEWLPGKALALSETCFPEVALGPMPHLYPFIVNDPGEGTQAKRRAQAVIIDHLTPPLTRAESYGPLAELEQLVDEYYEASGVDPRRLGILRAQILELSQSLGLDQDCGIESEDSDGSALSKLDNHLCELKELQIRDGLHIFGESPRDVQLDDLLVSLTRLPRSKGIGADASITRALASDLSLDGDGFDPLNCEFARAWTGPRPVELREALDTSWRTCGDTVERLELLARSLVSGERSVPDTWPATHQVLVSITNSVRPVVESCGHHEMAALLKGLDGRFVLPGPSGAPTRGRLDVLPTGRNFYSIDTRSVPTPAAWHLGWKSAALVIEHYVQSNGEWPSTMALSAWGTSNMRTGGDDIAQALALIGVRPTWEPTSRRVIGVEVIPLSLLDRPRVDVTLRISGFFRDAFPAQIDLFDQAVQLVAQLEEPDAMNPLAKRFKTEVSELMDSGVSEAEARRQSSFRVFGSKPGAYGAGLQALIDERGWQTDEDLASAYLVWGGYAYGVAAQGVPAKSLFESRLRDVEVVLHNQDNREHDLLDSDDYYQFEGGLAVAVRVASGKAPVVYHNDHSRPENPRIRTLEAEIARVVRARVVNPKWIEGVMRHGYKGAFEIAATVDYLFAFAATAHAVRDHHFDAVYAAFIDDSKVSDFMAEHNPDALREMAERLLEAVERGLWRPRSNSAGVTLTALGARDPERDAKRGTGNGGTGEKVDK